jgi:hypothetical protein
MVKALKDGTYLFKNGAIAEKMPNGRFKIIGSTSKLQKDGKAKRTLKKRTSKSKSKSNSKSKSKTQKHTKNTTKKRSSEKSTQPSAPKQEPDNLQLQLQLGGAATSNTKKSNSEKLRLTVHLLRDFYSEL